MGAISSIADAVTAVTTLINNALPSDAERLERLKARYPLIYARALRKAEAEKKKLLKLKVKEIEQIKEFCEKNNLDVKDFVLYLSNDTTKAELLGKLLNK